MHNSTFDYEKIEKIFDRTKKYYKENFERFKDKTVAILGCGGVGSFSAEFLARSGFNLILVDNDNVEISNLARQNYNIDDIGKPKVLALKEKIQKIYPVKIETFNGKISEKNILDIIKNADFVLIAFDNLKSMLIANEGAKIMHKNYVNGSATKQIGEIMFVTPESVCLNCIYKNKEDALPSIIHGVDSVVPTIIGLIASEMIINYFAFSKTYENYLYRFDFKEMSFYKIKLNKNPDCERCNGNYIYF